MQPGVPDQPLEPTRDADQHQASTGQPSPAVGSDQHTEAGRVVHLQVVQVHDQVTRAQVDRAVQRIAHRCHRRDVQPAADDKLGPDGHLVDPGTEQGCVLARSTGQIDHGPPPLAACPLARDLAPRMPSAAGGHVAARSRSGLDLVSITSPHRVATERSLEVAAERAAVASDDEHPDTGVVASWGSYSAFYGPIIAVAAVVVLVLLLRWTFGRGRSVVSRPARVGAEDEYGLLVPVAAPASFVEAELIRAQLVAVGIRATLAPTTSGPRVMVFPQEERVALAVLRGTS